MDPLVLAAGTAIVSALATSAWQQIQAAVVALWRQAHPERAAAIGAELSEARVGVLAARQRGDCGTEEALAGVWRLRLQELLTHDATAAVALRRLLDTELTRVLPSPERAQIQQVYINAQARGHARQNIAGRDLHITGS